MQAKNQVVTGIPRVLSSYMLTMTYCMAQKFNGNLPLIINYKIIIPCKIFVSYGSKYLHVILLGFMYLVCI